MKYLFTFACLNLKSHLRQSTIALCVIALSLCAALLVEGYVADVRKKTRDTLVHRRMYGEILVEVPSVASSTAAIPPETQAQLDEFLTQSENVTAVLKNIEFSGMISNGENSFIFAGRGYDPEAGVRLRGSAWEWNTIFGRPLQMAPPGGILIGRRLGKILNCAGPDGGVFLLRTGGYQKQEREYQCPNPKVLLTAFTDNGRLNSLNAVIGGIVDAGLEDLDFKYVETSMESAQRLLNTKNVGFYTIRVKHPSQIGPVLEDLKRFIGEKNLNLRAASSFEHEVGELQKQMLGFLSVFRLFVLIVVVLIAVFTIGSFFLRLVSERSREIGLMQSVGFPERSVQTLFVLESVLLAVAGVALGILVFEIVSLTLNTLPIYYRAGLFTESVRLQIDLFPSTLPAFSMLIPLISALMVGKGVHSKLQRLATQNLGYA